jgi:hypothetical protein
VERGAHRLPALPLPGRGTALTTPKAEERRTIRVPQLVAIELAAGIQVAPVFLAWQPAALGRYEARH